MTCRKIRPLRVGSPVWNLENFVRFDLPGTVVVSNEANSRYVDAGNCGDLDQAEADMHTKEFKSVKVFLPNQRLSHSAARTVRRVDEPLFVREELSDALGHCFDEKIY